MLRKDANDRRGGVIGAWAYGLHSVSREIDKITQFLYEDVLGSYRPKETKLLKIDIKIYLFPLKT